MRTIMASKDTETKNDLTSEPAVTSNSTLEMSTRSVLDSADETNSKLQSRDLLSSLVSTLNKGTTRPEDDGEDGDNDDDISSDVSGISDLSHESWQPVRGPIAWVQEQMTQGQSPRKILEELVPRGTVIPQDLDPFTLWKIIINVVSEPPKRKKLPDVNTLDDVIALLQSCKNIMVLTGAGVSVSCGIPDFRSRDGVYARLAKDFPNLPDPQAMFDIHFFRSDPRPFFKFAKEIYPGQFRPSPCHFFIRMLEQKGKLLRNYTQNIDTLEQVAGIENVIQCHGSFATASCTECGHKVNSDTIKADIFEQIIPKCPVCPHDAGAVMKPDIVFFGESLPEQFHNQMAKDKDECDLLIVIGSSLKVRPVALIPSSIPAHIPQILINRERLLYLGFDVELLGNCDDIVGELCRRLGADYKELAAKGPPLNQVDLASLPTPPCSPTSYINNCDSHIKTDTSENAVQTVTSTADFARSSTNQDIKKDHSVSSSTEVATSHSTTEGACAVSSPSKSDCKCESITSETMNTLVNACHKKDVVYLHTNQPTQLQSLSHSANIETENHEHGRSRPHHHSPTKKKFSLGDRNVSIDSDHDEEPQSKKARISDNEQHMDLTDDDCLDDIRSMWHSKRKVTLASRLSDNQVLFLPPSRYVFKGAEVYSDDEDVDSSDSELADQDNSVCTESNSSQDKSENSSTAIDKNTNVSTSNESSDAVVSTSDVFVSCSSTPVTSSNNAASH